MTFVPECNLNAESHVASEFMLSRYAQLEIVCEPARPNLYGVKTVDKSLYYDHSLFLLSERAVALHETIVSVNPLRNDQTPDEKSEHAVALFQRQLRSMRRFITSGRSASAIDRFTVSGKCDADGKQSPALQDDVAMAFMFGTYWASQHRKGKLRVRTNANPLKRIFDRPPETFVRNTEFGGEAFKRRAIERGDVRVPPPNLRQLMRDDD